MKGFFLIAFFLFSLFTKSQIVSTIPLERDDTFIPEEFIELGDHTFIELKRHLIEDFQNTNKRRLELSIRKYNRDMTLAKEVKVPTSGEGVSIYFSTIIESNKKFWLIYTEGLKPERKSKYANTMAFEIQPSTLEIGDPVVIANEADVDEVMDGYLNFGGYLPSFKIVFKTSPDKKHHLLLIGGNQDFYLSSLNENLTPIWKRKEEIPAIKVTDILSLAIDNSGNILISSANEKNPGILSVYPINSLPTHKAWRAGSDNVQDAKIVINNNGMINIAGTYLGVSGNISGVFRGTINIDRVAVEDIKQTVFPLNLIERLAKMKLGNTKPKKYGIYPWVIKGNLIADRNEGLHYTIEGTYSEPSVQMTGDILIANFDAANTSFSQVKRYSVYNAYGDYPQHWSAPCGSGVTIFYFDNQQNLNKDTGEEIEKLVWGKNKILIAATVGADGTVKKKQVTQQYSLGLWRSVNLFLLNECEK